MLKNRSTKIKEKIEGKRDSYWLFYLGIIFGISGSLIEGIIDRNIPHGYPYNFGIVVFFITTALLTFRSFKSEIEKK